MNKLERTMKGLVLGAIASLMGLGLAGCGKVNKENYDKLKMGMDYNEAVAILGEPEKCEALLAAKSCTWGKAPKTITIQVVGDKVVLFQSEGL